MKIETAQISFNEQHNPVSKVFGDVYFSNDNGVAETDYVFIEGNDLYTRWLIHLNTTFCIAETGFGTGLNFFRVAQWFIYFRLKNPKHVLKKLTFISCEKFPLKKEDAIQITNHWVNTHFLGLHHPTFDTNLDTYSTKQLTLTEQLSRAVISQWTKHYPDEVAGIHRREFSYHETIKSLPTTPVPVPALTNNIAKSPDNLYSIQLDLHYADAISTYNEIKCDENGMVDAWFLDGFAPSKNNDMWQPVLFEQLARLTKNKGTFATFTAAGMVKRGLGQVGFEVTKTKGFGRKRDMLIGTLNKSATRLDVSKLHAPYYQRNGVNWLGANIAKDLPKAKVISIVGSGIAGAITALKLVQKGQQVNLYWQGALPADGASGNPIGGFYPQLNAQNNHASQLQLQCFLYAQQFYQGLNKQSPYKHSWCGALQLGFNENTRLRLRKLLDKQLWPTDIARIVNASEASNIANVDLPYDCLYMPQAGWISPPSLVQACLHQAQKSGLLSIQANTTLQHYHCINNGNVELHLVTKDAKQKTVMTDALVLTLGDGSKSLLEGLIPFQLTRGQVEHLRSNPQLSKLRTLLCHKGYFTPAMDDFHALGSTYVKADTHIQTRATESKQNFKLHLDCLSEVNWLEDLAQSQHHKSNSARASIRCSTPDHLPVVGQVPSFSQFEELKDLYKAKPVAQYVQGSYQTNVFVLSGLGSRGLTTAPLMAETLVNQIFNQVLPLPASLLNALNPNRFIVRSLIKRTPFI